MADQAVSNERKKELEQLDPFQENILKGLALIKAYKKQLIVASTALIVVVAVFSGIMYSFKKAEKQAAELVSQALKSYAEVNDPAEGFAEAEKSFQAIFTEYANTSAGRQARIYFAKICYDASKFDQSYQNYKEALELFEHDALMENLILSSLGHVSLAKNEPDEAKKYFLKIEKGQIELLKDEARYTLAMLYEAESNPDESKEMYEKIITESENSMYNPIAKNKLGKIK